jgi:sensor c-di-GMP phosphodiesterase-like protein
MCVLCSTFLGIVISLSSASTNEPLTFLVNDISAIETKVKHMPIIEIADVQVLLYEALSKEGSEADRLFTVLSNRALQRLPMPHLYVQFFF